ADAALLRGCYDCLIDAREIYRKLPVGGRAASAAAAAAWVFETDLLIALREKEIGLPSSSALTEARRIARELPRDLEAGRYIELVEAIPGCELGTLESEVKELPAHLLGRTATADTRAWLVRGKLRKAVRDYLQIALACIDPIIDENLSAAALGAGSSPSSTGATQPEASLLLRYRVAISKPDATPELEAVRASEPRFVEASLFIARNEIGRLPFEGPRQAKVHLDEVLVRFPASTAATYLAASYHQLVGDYAEALRLYERTLDLRPDHDPALLGRVISLSNLGRTRDAIDAATRLIARGEPYSVNAYYWRARNLHALGRLDDARRDVSAAKELGGSEDLLLLAGTIEYEQGDLDVAQADLTIVVNADADGRACEARWYLGLVDRQRKRWSSARHALEDAMTCYQQRARTTTDQLHSLQARSDLDPTYRDRAAAGLEAAVAADTRQQDIAALDAAGIAAAGDDFAGARSLVDLAAEDPALADRVAKLRSWLDRSHRVSP
ncbi:MAG TPA: tetratricopeptide repeat protein, partial [Kofleriaceae bacterium]|nr:tetratricopeptide repeat protein [Kofleriaceae bacterium]